MAADRACSCGSGLPRYALTDAAGIFCAYVCEDCEDDRRRGFNPAIFSGRGAYASTGDEADIGSDLDCDGY